MSSLESPQTGKAYWRSLDELADTPAFRAFVEREFPNHAGALLTGPSRRQFLKVMGASFAFAGLTACRWPAEKIVPYAHRPEGRTPGVPVRFATAIERRGVAQSVLVSSYDGRPVKVEGNPLDPINAGSSDAQLQAAILEMYDPDRGQLIVRREQHQRITQDQESFLAFARPHFAALRAKKGAGLAILSEATSSLTVAAMRRRLSEVMPEARWYEYEPIVDDNEREGTRIALGRPYRVQYVLDAAEVIVCLDADVLMQHPAASRHARAFASGRAAGGPDPRMNRLYVFESTYTVTGGVADHRVAIRSSEIAALAMRLAAKVGVELPDGAATSQPVADAVVDRVAKDLLAHAGRCVVAAGACQPPGVHALVCAINAALGSVGQTVGYTAAPDPDRARSVGAIRMLAAAMRDGRVDTLLILGGNPVYNAPADVLFAAQLAKISTSIHLSVYEDETSRACSWHVPRAHALETWDAYRSYDGTICTAQPLIDPLYGGRTAAELLATVAGMELPSAYALTREAMREHLPEGDFESAWRKWLHDGVVAGSALAVESPRVDTDAVRGHAASYKTTVPKREGDLEVAFRPGSMLDDGRYANNGWLQEAPDPITRLTWDNAALIAPATAQQLGVQEGEVVLLKLGNKAVALPAYVLPGQAARSITVTLGYGRRAAGRVGDGVGADVYALRTTVAMDFALGAAVAPTGRTHTFACVQNHHAIDEVGAKAIQQRIGGQGEIGELTREATLEEYKHHPGFAKHAVELPADSQLWQAPVAYDSHRWAMAIDLTKCTGCSACVLACQAENNIPVVGKEQVRRGREMQWIRVDRYFKGSPDAPSLIHQPVPCMHCENAPCEQVCPVAATVHDTEGLNVMVYNRCIGTRYCSNNCPYKVRRFNFFNYRRNMTDTEKMAMNPEVTVRSRGVMEKCTYCVQRIQAVKIVAKNERRPIADGEITPACAQACPARAIVFGDLNDPNSEVRRWHEHDRSYAMLGELNVRARTVYLARLRNPAGDAGAPGDEGLTNEHDDGGH
jgi:MoCo/4Fe-4S cofactor protein with predicted Tat translocation signal